MGKLQCKDIPDLPILLHLKKHDRSSCHRYKPDGRDEEFDQYSVCHAMPSDLPDKLIIAKMRMMIRRGVVDGCSCGCRGDYYLTPYGKDEIERLLAEASPCKSADGSTATPDASTCLKSCSTSAV